MDVVSLSSTNFIGLTSNYTFDPVTSIDQELYYTENGVDIPLINAFKQLNDNTINNFSNLFLTTRSLLSGSVYIEDLQPVQDEGFSTYLATNALRTINDSSRFLVVQEPDFTQNTAQCAMTGSFANLNSRYMFDVKFISDKLCKISHRNENIIRYLTVDYLGSLVFAKDANLDYLGDLSPQIFYYVYDRDTDFIVFLKNVNDIVKYIVFSPVVQNIALGDPLTAADIPYVSRAIMRCTPRSESPNDTKLYDPWVSYNKNLKINSQDINLQRSYPAIPGNLLINNEYYSVTGTDMSVNVLSLKNSNTPENYQTRGNPFQRQRSNLFAETEVEMRDYKKLFTGSNQLYGNDNISVGFESFTTDIILKKDSITYFHIPQDFYPYIQLNINDSGLTEAGSIAGDHPLKSDKVFKKLGSYKYTSPFGEVRDEASGNFLCSWLSGNWDINTRPIWIDRYYNPRQISFLAALSADPFQAIKYITVSECLFAEVNDILGMVDVFDKPSDLIFEPGAYYAYHHYGLSDVRKYINSLEPFIVNSGVHVYNTLYGLPAQRDENKLNEFVFDGNRYAISQNLSAIQESGQFTLSFWLKNNDWSKPFGDQFIGNYANDGFGIFNQNVTTPTLYVNSVTGVYVLNTDLKRLKTLVLDEEIADIIRLDNISDYYIIFKSGFIKKYNSSDAETRSRFNSNFTNLINIDYDDSTIFALCTGATPLLKRIIRVDIPEMSIGDITPLLLNQETYKCAVDNADFQWNSSVAQQTKFHRANSVDIYNNIIYITPGRTTRRVNNNIFYQKDDKTIVKWSDIDGSTLQPVLTTFKSNSQIEDFNIDFDNNIWILTDDNKFYKYTLDREFLLSGETPNNSFKNSKIGFMADFFEGEYTKQVLLSQQGTIELSPNLYKSYWFDLINDTGDSFISNFFNTMEANVYQPLSASGILFNILDTEGNIINSSSVLAVTGFNLEPTNSDYLRKIIAPKYPKPNFNVKATMTNIFNDSDLRTVDITYNLSSFDPGYHHFAIRVDTYEGFMALFIDGIRIEMKQFEPRRYQFNNFNDRPFLLGTSNFINSIPLFKYLKKNASIAKGITIKDFNIYNRALKDTDIAMLAKENMTMEDIVFTIPCGRRNYVEEFERYFKATIPGTKASLFNVVIKNSGILNPDLRSALEKRIITTLKQLAPVYSKLNTIKWIN